MVFPFQDKVEMREQKRQKKKKRMEMEKADRPAPELRFAEARVATSGYFDLEDIKLGRRYRQRW